MTDEGMVTVYFSQGPLGAEVALSKLQSLGIPALLRYQAIGRVLGLTVDGLGQVEVRVPLAYEDDALLALAESPVELSEAEDVTLDADDDARTFYPVEDDGPA
ncbi:MAG: hypothetical protein ACYC5M_02245 [Anaerolineae bacterium]